MAVHVILTELAPGVWGIAPEHMPGVPDAIMERFIADMGNRLTPETKTLYGGRFIKTPLAQRVAYAISYGAGEAKVAQIVDEQHERDRRAREAEEADEEEAPARGQRSDATLRSCLPKVAWRKLDPKLDGPNSILDDLPMKPATGERLKYFSGFNKVMDVSGTIQAYNPMNGRTRIKTDSGDALTIVTSINVPHSMRIGAHIKARISENGVALSWQTSGTKTINVGSEIMRGVADALRHGASKYPGDVEPASEIKEPWLNLPTLAERSRAAHDYASDLAAKSRSPGAKTGGAVKTDMGWNRRYREALQSIGYDIHAVSQGDMNRFPGNDVPISAPRPAPAGMIYPWPSVVAPKDWLAPPTGE